MPGVFLNYRVSDGETYAGWIDETLSNRIGAHNVFRASRSIPVGAAFDERILAVLSRCDVVVAVIGPQWLTPRLRDDGDWVRRELAEAIRLDIPIIPVLVADAGRLDGADLPDELKPLANAQYLRLHYRSAHTALPQLVDTVFTYAPALAVEEVMHQLIVHVHFGNQGEPEPPAEREHLRRAIRDAFVESHVAPNQYRIEDRGSGGLLVVLPAEVVKSQVLGAWINSLEKKLENGPRIRVGVHSGAETSAVDTELACDLSGSTVARGLARAARDARVVVLVSDRVHHSVVSKGGRGVERNAYRKVTVAPDIPAWYRVVGWSVPPAVPDEPAPVADRPEPAEPVSQTRGNGSSAGWNILENNGIVVDTINGRNLHVGDVHNYPKDTW
jgi:hypothetical protein